MSSSRAAGNSSPNTKPNPSKSHQNEPPSTTDHTITTPGTEDAPLSANCHQYLFSQNPMHFSPDRCLQSPQWNQNKEPNQNTEANSTLARQKSKLRTLQSENSNRESKVSSQKKRQSKLQQWKKQMKMRRQMHQSAVPSNRNDDFTLVLTKDKKNPLHTRTHQQKSTGASPEKSSPHSSSQNTDSDTTDAESQTKTIPPLTYKISRTQNRVISQILESHGFVPSTGELSFNLFWTGSHLRAYLFKSLNVFQKINHFPMSFELTTKSNMYKKYMEMKNRFPSAYDYLPKTWILPREYSQMCEELRARRSNNNWYIVKPASSSAGRGISVIGNKQELDEALGKHESKGGNSPSKKSTADSISSSQKSKSSTEFVCSEYVGNPALISHTKYDIRLYVAVLSYNPLRIYLYEDGLVRFAAEKYNLDPENRSNNFIHLTNYSINKKSENFVFNTDAQEDGLGNKWSVTALKSYLQEQNVDVDQVFRSIEDVIIKSILTVEADQRSALRNFVSHPHSNCFELYGFDILLNEEMKPFLMEVNLSPSLAIGTPLDEKIKVGMLTDLFNLAQIRRFDPARYRELRHQNKKVTVHHLYQHEELSKEEQKLVKGLSKEERTVLIQTLREDQQKGRFKRIFPSSDSHSYRELISTYSGLNQMLHERLYCRGNTGHGIGS